MNTDQGILPEAIGVSDLDVLNSALERLFTQLRKAQVQFKIEGDDGRQGAFTALGALWKFITLFRRPREESLHTPILRLHDALVMLNQNRVEPILRSIRRKGRAPSSHAHAALKGHAAATVHRLLAAGRTRNNAHEEVAKALGRVGVRSERGRGVVSATTVRNWCDEISADVGRHTTAALMYDSIVNPDEMKRFLLLPKDNARCLALQSLTQWVQKTFAERQKPS